MLRRNNFYRSQIIISYSSFIYKGFYSNNIKSFNFQNIKEIKSNKLYDKIQKQNNIPNIIKEKQDSIELEKDKKYKTYMKVLDIYEQSERRIVLGEIIGLLYKILSNILKIDIKQLQKECKTFGKLKEKMKGTKIERYLQRIPDDSPLIQMLYIHNLNINPYLFNNFNIEELKEYLSDYFKDSQDNLCIQCKYLIDDVYKLKDIQDI